MRFSRQIMTCFFLFCVFINSSAQNIDVDILKSINPDDPSSGYWQVTSSSAYWLSATVLAGSIGMGICRKDPKRFELTKHLLVGLAVSTFVSEGLKVSIDRSRPADTYPGVIFANSPTHGRSFPSGHATLAFTTAATLAFQYKKWYVAVPAFVWAGSVGYSRMYLGEHYPTDILAGALIGTGSAYASLWLNKKLFHRKSLRS